MNLCECLREDTGSTSLSPIDPKNPGPPHCQEAVGRSQPPSGPQFSALLWCPQGLWTILAL